jgi:hypothetical protein
MLGLASAMDALATAQTQLAEVLDNLGLDINKQYDFNKDGSVYEQI